MRRRVAFFFLTFALSCGHQPAGAWETDCNAAIPAAMVDTVSSRTAYPGMPFRFRVTVSANLNGVIVPQDTIGWGYVRSVTGASNHGRDGSLLLEPRVVIYDNKQIPVMGYPLEGASWSPGTTLTERASGYVPVPGEVRTVVNEFRKGRDITVGPGSKFHVIALGDPRTAKICRKVGDS